MYFSQIFVIDKTKTTSLLVKNMLKYKQEISNKYSNKSKNYTTKLKRNISMIPI